MTDIFALAALAAAPPAVAQHAPSPYAGQEQRAIKALSADEVAGYLAGEGLGFAKAAELNGYPGPRHVIDLADRLALGADQRQAVQAVFGRMQRAAVDLGRTIVAREGELDALFAAGRIEPERLSALTGELGVLNGRLRAVHLAAHLEIKAILSAEQVAHYNRLRGYGGGGGPQHRH